MTASTLTTKTTSELSVGDVVLCHGMRCLIDGEILVSQSHPDRPGVGGGKTRYTQALVLNRDDESTSVAPRSWTADWKRNCRGESLPHDGEHRWTIQGNDLARWAVENALRPAGTVADGRGGWAYGDHGSATGEAV